MCAIVDANVRDEIITLSHQSDAGKFFYEWLMKPNGGTLVAGGKLLKELNNSWAFQQVFSNRLQAGRARRIRDEAVDDITQTLVGGGDTRSDDEHVLALALVSGARLLFTNDRALQQDFGDPRLIHDPRGSVYTTLLSKNVTDTHKDLLQRRDLCGEPT